MATQVKVSEHGPGLQWPRLNSVPFCDSVTIAPLQANAQMRRYISEPSPHLSTFICFCTKRVRSDAVPVGC